MAPLVAIFFYPLVLQSAFSNPTVTNLAARTTPTNSDAAVQFGTWSGKAFNERYTVLSSNAVVLPFAASQQAFITNLKARATNVLVKFANQSVAANEKFDAWFGPNSIVEPFYAAANFPLWSVTGLVTHLGAPTNFFAATPWTDLATNAFGWQNMTSVVRTLVWTPARVTEDYPIDPPLGRWWGGAHTSSWSVAVSIATTNTGPNFWIQIFRYTQGTRYTDVVYAAAETICGYISCNASTQFYKEVDFYQGATAPMGFIADHSTFDASGDSVTTNWTWKATVGGMQGSFSNLFGDTSLSLANWVDDPPPDTLTYARGYDLYGGALVRWIGLNFR